MYDIDVHFEPEYTFCFEGDEVIAMNRSDLYSFGALLKEFRSRKYLTQQKLAEQLGMRRNTVGTWERGDALPKSKGTVLEIARHLQLDDQEARQLLEASLTAFSPYWYVPFPRNPLFTGRVEILEALHTQLGAEQVVALTQPYALHGLGGIGKTQIALEYAYRHMLEYNAVFWISAETRESILSSLLRIAEVLQLPGRKENDQQLVVAEVQRWLTTHKQWLLIWDNLEEMELLQQVLPPIRPGAILVTTRCQALGTLAEGIDLEPMAHEEGILFLLRRAKVLKSNARHAQQFAVDTPDEYAAATELVTAMEGLPLALDQAGAYIEETGCSLKSYLQHYKQQHTLLLDRRGGPGNAHPQSVAATFRISMERVEREQNVAADILRVCALVHAEAIPEEMFVAGAIHLGPGIQALAADPSLFDQALGALRNLSLVRRQPATNTLSLHRLVQVVLREAMSEQERVVWQQRVVHTLNALFPEVSSENSVHVWKQCERLLPHVLAGVARYTDQVRDQALVRVLDKAANYLCQRAQFALAEPLYEQALCLGEQILGALHPEMVPSLIGLANLYQEQGKFELVKPLYERALKIREKEYGLEHPLVVDPLIGLAIFHRKQGKYEQAEMLYERALRIREQSPCSEDRQMAQLLHNLAHLYEMRGKYKPAESMFQRSIRIEEQVWGPEHQNLVYPLVGLAIVYQALGKDELAEPLFQRGLDLCERVWGPEHLLVAYPLHNLAVLYQGQGKYELAERLFQRALRIAEQVWGPDHPQIAHPLTGLADLYAEQGKDEPAELLYQRALHIREQTLGAEHPDLASSLNGLANLYLAQRKDELAEPLYQRARAIREQHLGQHHPETAQTLHDSAIFYQKQSRLSEALTLAKRALKIRAQSLGDLHPKTVATRKLYTQLVQGQERLEHERSTAYGAKELQKRLLKQHLSQKTLISAQRAAHTPEYEDDPLREFLDTCCELHARAQVRVSDLWQAYEQWAVEHHERFPLSRRAFAAQLKAHGCHTDRTSTARNWRGIALIDKSS